MSYLKQKLTELRQKNPDAALALEKLIKTHEDRVSSLWLKLKLLDKDDTNFFSSQVTYHNQEAQTKMTKKNKINKYYVGAVHIAAAIENGTNAQWTHATEQEAIAHGKRIMNAEDKDTVVICKIIKVIRRAKAPVIIESL